MKYLLMVVLLFSFVQARATYFFDGNDLLERCEAYVHETSVAKGNTCAGYIMGVLDSYSTFRIHFGTEETICTPAAVSISQLVRVVTKGLQENPKDLHKTSDSLVLNFIFEAFPCE